MKKHFAKRLLSIVLAGILALSGVTMEASAAGSGTYAGEEETVTISSADYGTRETNFNDDWKFYLGTSSTAQNPGFNDSQWESVTLPHDFSISQSYTTSGEAESGFLPGGTGWYRKTITMPEAYADQRIVIQFDGVYANAYVYVNGTQVGEHHYGYTGFALDITDYLTCDGSTENVIAVKAVNQIPSSRWYSGSGIYRDVTLVITGDAHVGYHGIFVTTPDIENGTGTVAVAAEVVNDGDSDVQVTVRNTVYEKNGSQVSESVETAVTITAGETATVENECLVEEPQLWSTEQPNLYTVKTEILADGAVIDTCETNFGFRYFRFDSETGFYLNGEAVKLNGVCMHHDQGALGSAAYYDAMYRQLSIMKNMGVNAIRTSHNPADEDFIQICSELGLLVIEEAFDGWELPKNGNSNDFSVYFNETMGDAGIIGAESTMTWAEFALKSMIRRDRSQPCIILWSVGNEVSEGTSTNSDFASITAQLISWIKEVDTTRQATIGSNQRTTSGTFGAVHEAVVEGGGIVGFNYASASELASMHNAYGPIIAAETSSATNSRSVYVSQANNSNADGDYHLTSYDTSSVSWGMPAHDSMYNTLTNDYVAGEFVWTGFDYLGEPTPWNGVSTGSVSYAGAIPNSSYFGMVETTGFVKDTYYLYRSQWNQSENTLHLVTAWDSDNMYTTGGKTPIVVYSNAAKVELYRNEELIGTATRKINATDAGHTYYTYTAASNDTTVCTAVAASGADSLYATFNVTYEAGTISAKAYDENNTLITDYEGNASVSTPGTVSSLKISADKESITADGSSLVYITVDVTDASGVLDTTAENNIQFSLNGDGEIVGVDNGDQATTAKYQQSSVLTDSSTANIDAYAGKALVIVRSTKNAGSFTLTASASGLTGASVAVTTTAAVEETQEGVVSYTMIRDYSVAEGTEPVLQTGATGVLADGTTVTGIIVWEEIPASVYETAGDYVINGVLYFEGQEELSVSCRLHVIAAVIALRNVSAVTMSGVLPTLPDSVAGVLEDGTLSGEFTVDWDLPEADVFTEVGDIVLVEGTAVILGEETLPVTASVRIAETVNTESYNVAPLAAEVTQDIVASNQSDNLASIYNEVTDPGDNTEERWSNWNNRTTSADATLTFRWDTAWLLESVNLHYYYDSCAAKPEAVSFAYSLDGVNYTEIQTQETFVQSYALGAEYSYTFAETICPVALRITLTQQDGTTGSHCVALTEVEIMNYAGTLTVNSQAALDSILVDGKAIEGFDGEIYTYSVSGTSVTASTAVNAGITVLPALEQVVRILTISEDQSDARVYAVTLTDSACGHENTEIRNKEDATCEDAGYTGDLYCTDCGELLESGSATAETQLRQRGSNEGTDCYGNRYYDLYLLSLWGHENRDHSGNCRNGSGGNLGACSHDFGSCY